MTAGVVIVGAGHAGFETAAALRRAGFDEQVMLIGDDAALPYQRPPLSKGFLAGTIKADAVAFRTRDFYEHHEIDLRRKERVVAVDRASQTVALASGGSLPYEHLVLATGAQPRRLLVPGGNLDGVFYLRTLADAEVLAARLRNEGRAAVIGGGFIGLEFAAVASSLGVETIIVEALPRLMARAVTEHVSEFYALEHARWGCQVLASHVVRRIVPNGEKAGGVELDDGRTIAADTVVVAIGIEPSVQLAQQSSLRVDNGVVVDHSLRTDDPRIFAIGDCASFPSPLDGRHVRLESVQNAADQAACAAEQLVGRPSRYRAVPWFWSDQRDLKLQMAGLSTGHDQVVVRGDPADRSFSVFWFRSGTLLGGESVNRPGDHVVVRRLLTGQPNERRLTPEQAADPSFDLKPLAKAAAAA
jgi:3-phenylpropionate/trans-cinnamate dioxygenase ferredoxin reductase component